MPRVLSLLPLLVLTLAPLPALAVDKGDNLRATLTITDDPGTPRPGTNERTFELVAREGTRAQLVSGWRIPVTEQPARRQRENPKHSEHDARPAPTTHQNVGVTLQLETATHDRGIWVRASVELSAIDGDPETGDPTPRVGTYQQTFEAVIPEGEPFRIGRFPWPEDRYRTLSLRLDSLD